MSAGPPERIERWLHNQVGLYAAEATALSVIPPGHEGAYTLFAYRALRVCFREGEEHPWDPWAGRPAEPLSCNGVAAEHEVDRFCLRVSEWQSPHEITDTLSESRGRHRDPAGKGRPGRVVQVLLARPHLR